MDFRLSLYHHPKTNAIFKTQVFDNSASYDILVTSKKWREFL